MKKLFPVFLACIIGSASAFYLFNIYQDKIEYVENNYNLIGVQIGVFTKEDNAKKMKDNIGGMVVMDNDLYRVYYAILNSTENIETITSYLDNKGVSYYLKNLYIKNETLEENEKYEKSMNKAKDIKAKLKISSELLGLYGKEL